MRKQLYLFFILIASCWACQDVPVGYLKAENAGYLPDELEIRKTLDPQKDAVRIENEAPWVTQSIQGILGTEPLEYKLIDVKVSEGGDAELFREEMVLRGAGVMELPLYTKLPAGRYTVTLKVSNDGHSQLLPDVFTFVVK